MFIWGVDLCKLAKILHTLCRAVRKPLQYSANVLYYSTHLHNTTATKYLKIMYINMNFIQLWRLSCGEIQGR